MSTSNPASALNHNYVLVWETFSGQSVLQEGIRGLGRLQFCFEVSA